MRFRGFLLLALPLVFAALAYAEPKDYFNPHNDTQFGNEFNLESKGAYNINLNTKNASYRFIPDVGKTPVSAWVPARNKTSFVELQGRLEYDDGTTNHFPNGTIMCSGTVTPTVAAFYKISLSGCPALTAGNYYHFTVGNAKGNSSSYNTMFYAAFGSAAQDTSTEAVFLTYSGTSWSPTTFTEPLILVEWSDGTYYGNGAETNTNTTICGKGNSAGFGEYFTVTGGDKIVTKISMYAACNNTTPRPSDDLNITIAQGTTVLYNATFITNTSCSTGYGTPTSHTLSTPVTLTNGTAYRIFLTSAGSSSPSCYMVNRISTSNNTPFDVWGHYQQLNAQWTRYNGTSGQFQNDYQNADLYFNVTVGARIEPAQFRIYESSDNNTLATGTLRCNITSSYGHPVSEGTSTACATSLAPNTRHRAEIWMCNDVCGGFNESFTNVTHDALNQYYLGAFTTNDCGHTSGTSLSSVTCVNESSGSNQMVKIQNASTTLASTCARDSSSCHWYTYMFNTSAPATPNTSTTNISSTGVTTGITQSSGNLLVTVTYSALGFSMSYPSTGCTAGQGYSNTQAGCNPGACPCNRCYIEPSSPTQDNVSCQGQTSSLSFYDFLNQGTQSEAWTVALNDTFPYGVTYKMDTDNNPSGAQNVSTSTVTINASVGTGQHAYAWAWGDFASAAGGNATRDLTHTSS